MSAAPRPRVGVVDLGLGNRRSVEKALAHIGAEVEVSADPRRLVRADGLVVPGVGAFPRGRAALRAGGLDELLRERLHDGVPVLGVCLGMQLFFSSSTELGGEEGLGVIEGPVEALEAPGLKLPHIGWNEIALRRAPGPWAQMPERAAFYHVHSFAGRPDREEDVVAVGDYGGPFVSAVARGSFHGVQFHPEKSSVLGLRLLREFAALCARGSAVA